ncbi:MAG: hypothetical protein IKV54_06040 [Clostridia bacterium]|nr:hypothetical protein [Clostridia bacterium]
MYKVLRFLLCYAIAFAALYISGYENLMNDISESMALTTFFMSALVLGVVAFLILELYLSFKRKIARLTERIDKLEEENRNLKKDTE